MSNFTEKLAMTKREVAILVDLVMGEPIITSRETNAATNKIKDIAWNEIKNQFNSKTINHRSVAQLRAKWDNLKKSARKRSQKIQANNLKNEGEEPYIIPPDEILDKVSGILWATCSDYVVPTIHKITEPLVTIKAHKRKIADPSGMRRRNVAIANYYDQLAEKTKVETEILRIKRERMIKNESDSE